jgi:uncharacterized protein involved in response to NO
MAFRPFFLMAGLWPVVALWLWIAAFTFGVDLPSCFDPLNWHIHEMLFGLVLAAVAGFLLTAIPNWTGRRPICGVALAGLTGLWLAGRIICLVSAFAPPWLAPIVDLAFPLALFAVARRELIAARNQRNLAIPAPIAVLGIADLLMHLEAAGYPVPVGLGWRLGLAAVIVLIAVIGGRIIPSFMRNWLIKRGAAMKLPRIHRGIDRLALGCLHAGLVAWAILPTSRTIGLLLIFASACNFIRLAGWRGFSTFAEPLLAILHVGYLWLVLGAAMLGVSLLSHTVPETAAIHALTSGAIGTMIVAVMSRVTLGHTGRMLVADRITTFLYIIVVAGAVLRVTAVFAPANILVLIVISAILWSGGFLLFVLRYGPMLITERID